MEYSLKRLVLFPAVAKLSSSKRPRIPSKVTVIKLGNMLSIIATITNDIITAFNLVLKLIKRKSRIKRRIHNKVHVLELDKSPARRDKINRV